MFVALIVIARLLPIIFTLLLVLTDTLDEKKQRITTGQRDLNAGKAKYDKYNNWFVRIFAKKKLAEGRRDLEEGQRQLTDGRRKWNFWNRIRYVLLGLCAPSFIFLIAGVGYKVFGNFGWVGLLIFVVLTLLWSILFFLITIVIWLDFPVIPETCSKYRKSPPMTIRFVVLNEKIDVAISFGRRHWRTRVTKKLYYIFSFISKGIWVFFCSYFIPLILLKVL